MRFANKTDRKLKGGY